MLPGWRGEFRWSSTRVARSTIRRRRSGSACGLRAPRSPNASRSSNRRCGNSAMRWCPRASSTTTGSPACIPKSCSTIWRPCGTAGSTAAIPISARSASSRICSRAPNSFTAYRRRLPSALHARVGVYCYDTMTLVGPGSWQAIRAATDVARTAVDLVASGAPGRLCADTAAGSPRDEVRVRRVVLPQQRRGRRTGAARRRIRTGRRRRHRRPPRQRHPGDLLRAARRLHDLRSRRPRCGLVSAPRRFRRRDRARRGLRRQSEPAARPRIR